LDTVNFSVEENARTIIAFLEEHGFLINGNYEPENVELKKESDPSQ
jgi:hypothetical protein